MGDCASPLTPVHIFNLDGNIQGLGESNDVDVITFLTHGLHFLSRETEENTTMVEESSRDKKKRQMERKGKKILKPLFLQLQGTHIKTFTEERSRILTFTSPAALGSS